MDLDAALRVERKRAVRREAAGKAKPTPEDIAAAVRLTGDPNPRRIVRGRAYDPDTNRWYKDGFAPWQIWGEAEEAIFPTCDLCGITQSQDPFVEYDWNGVTGNHQSCEAKARAAVVRTVMMTKPVDVTAIVSKWVPYMRVDRDALYIEHRDTDVHTGDNYVDGCPTCEGDETYQPVGS